MLDTKTHLTSDVPLHLKELNENQIEAVLHHEGALLVLAGAGTGKTKVLTARIANLIFSRKAYPTEILAVTFTNKAAREMLQRVEKFVDSAGLWLGTFHAIAAKILRRHAEIFDLSSNFTIIGVDDQLRLLKNILKEENIDDKKYPPKLIQHIIQRWKDRALKFEDIDSSCLISTAHHIAKNIYKHYQNKLRFLDAVDFGDLLLFNIELFNSHVDILEIYQNRLKYILVDEYQDTNIAQYLWLRLLASKSRNIACVGDEDQSIYGWRGAEIDNILRFEKDFPQSTIIRLEQNYRSTTNILTSASKLISHNYHRLGKNLWANAEHQGEKVNIVTCWTEKEEAEYIVGMIEKVKLSGRNLNDIAILVRASFQTRNFEECFINRNIPYKIIGGLEFYERQEIKDVIAYIRAITNLQDSLAFERIINLPKRGIGPSSLAEIMQFATLNRISLFSAIKEMVVQDLLKPKIKTTLSELVEKFAKWKEYFTEFDVSQAVMKIVEESGYLAMREQEKSIESTGRVENIKELIQSLRSYPSITEFIEHVSLVADNDKVADNELVNIMTIHAAKGLEFHSVFLPGWEESIFPHQRTVEEAGTKGIEEERRLAYVAITRAKNKLTITQTSCRNIFGQWQTTIPSRFLNELPAENIVKLEFKFGASYNTYSPEFSSSIYKLNDSMFKLGDRVSHNKFGLGYILSISDNQIEISFDNYGTKKILSEFVRKC